MARRDAGDGALDPALTQKKRARRRLVGALVLGLAAAIVLPLVLDSEPRQTITDVQIEIPPRDTPLPAKADDAPGRSAELALVPPAEPAPPAGAPAVPAAAEPAKVDAPKAEAPKGAAAKAGTGSEAGAEAGRRPEAEAARRPEAEIGRRPEAEIGRRPEAGVAEPRSLPAKSPPRTAAASASAPVAPGSAPAPSASRAEARFAVQLGAFANAGSARAQADKARKAGVRVYTEGVTTAQGERTRVRAGPFASREAAEQARTKLKAAGIDASVVPL